ERIALRQELRAMPNPAVGYKPTVSFGRTYENPSEAMAQNVNVVIHFSTNRQGNLAKIALPSVIVCGCYSFFLQKGPGSAMRPTPEDVVIEPEIQMSIPGGRLALCSALCSANVRG